MITCRGAAAAVPSATVDLLPPPSDHRRPVLLLPRRCAMHRATFHTVCCILICLSPLPTDAGETRLPLILQTRTIAVCLYAASALIVPGFIFALAFHIAIPSAIGCPLQRLRFVPSCQLHARVVYSFVGLFKLRTRSILPVSNADCRTTALSINEGIRTARRRCLDVLDIFHGCYR